MPRLDHRPGLDTFGYETRMIMTLLITEINLLREEAGLPPRTPQQVRQAVLAYVRDHPRPHGQRG
jgi:hypothetical protein